MVWMYVRQAGGQMVRRCLGVGLWQTRWGAAVGEKRRLSSSAEHIVSSSVSDVQILSGINAAVYTLQNANRWPTNIALECAVSGRSYTYAQVVDGVARWGGCLTRLGLAKGDKLAIMMLNCPEYALVFIGTMSVGISVTFINNAYTPEEVHHQLKDSDPSLIVYDDATAKVVEAALSLHHKPVKSVINTDASPPAGVPSLRSLLQDSSVPLADPVEVGGTETAILPYSSGTTGKPKGVDLSHDALASDLASLCHSNFCPTKVTTESYQDNNLCYLPFFHVYGILIQMSASLCCGAKIITVPKFDSSAFVHQITKYKLRGLQTVPPVLNFLAQSPDVTPESMKSVESVLCGAAPVPQSSAEVLQQKMDKSIFFQEGYGMTEVLITHLTPLGSKRLATCGQCLPNVKCKVINTDTGKSLPANETGEICFMSPSRMTGYINNEGATQATIDADGWLHSGDIGFYDDHGYFTIVDRIKELIKVKALQVAPSDLEDVILQHPKVKEVGVVGVPHDRFGEAPRAYVVTSSPITEKEIHEFLETRVAPHKRLAGGVKFISQLPKTASGKIIRQHLKKM